jgi:YggT family protein
MRENRRRSGHLGPAFSQVKDGRENWTPDRHARGAGGRLAAACPESAEPIHQGHHPPEKRPAPMRALLDVILIVLQLYIWLLIAAAILSWLIAFNVVNTRNQFVAMVGDFLWRITEPLLRPIRSIMPNLGGIDISPVILILIIIFLQSVITRYIYPNVF